MTHRTITIPAADVRRFGDRFPHYRPRLIRAIGEKIHPRAVVEAWYAADCPPSPWRPPVDRRTYRRWRLACLLRGV